ncbi:unnamed protein product [Hapterophycus canaliculatus]
MRRQGGERAASTAVSACLSFLVRLEREKSAYVCGGGDGGGGNRSVSPEVKLYHLANACLYGASVLSGLGADENFDRLLTRYLEQCGGGFEVRLAEAIARLSLASAPDPAKMIADAAAAAGGGTSSTGGAEPPATAQDRVRAARAQQSHGERALLEFVKDLVGSFLADSFGIPSFARVLRVFLRTGFPASARRVVWKELGDVGLLHLLDPPGSTTTTTTTAKVAAVTAASAADPGTPGPLPCHPRATTDDAYLYPSDTEGGIIEAYLSALEHPRFGPTVATEGGKECLRRRAGSSTGGEEDNPTGAEVLGEAGEGATASAAENSREEPEEIQSATTLVPMWEVAVHHLACYLFSLPPRPGTGPPPAPADDPPSAPLAGSDGQGEPPWRPDFGRRKTFERLLRQHAGKSGARNGGGVPGSVAAAVLGYRCPGSSTPSVAGDEVAAGGRGEEEAEGCMWTSGLGRRRCELLRAYCRASGGLDSRGASAVCGVEKGEVASAGGILAWLDEGRSVADAAERLAHAVNP